MKLHVLTPGPLTTVQDAGREGWRHLGIARAGALDVDAAALANRLAGNAPGCAVLEFTLQGPTLQFDAPVRLAMCGARTAASHVGRGGVRTRVGHGRPVELPPGRLEIGVLKQGARGWIAFAGGIDVPRVLGSRSTDLRGGFGGLEGRGLTRGDVLTVASPSANGKGADGNGVRQPAWWVAFDDPPPPVSVVRYVPGPHPAAGRLPKQGWRVDNRSNRQGLRLDGTPLPVTDSEMISAAVAPGTIQLPPDGKPIVLLADAQTTGGYPRLGHVIACDLHVLAQLRPGDPLHWEAVDAAQARALWLDRQFRLARLHHLVRERLGDVYIDR
jgi:antagonist of KipI